MQIILIKPVRKLGKVGEVVNVKDGYGRNFLIPQGIGIRATKENLSKFAAMQSQLEAKHSQEKVAMQAAAERIQDKHLIFVTQSGADGRLFGSISLKMLAISISDLAGYSLNYSNILLESPIKFNGVHKVQVMFHPEISSNVLVVVAKSDSEAQDALRDYKEGSRKDNDQGEIAASVSEGAKKAEDSQEAGDAGYAADEASKKTIRKKAKE